MGSFDARPRLGVCLSARRGQEPYSLNASPFRSLVSDCFEIVPDNAQHQGARGEQQDAFAFSDPNDRDRSHAGFLAIVADGMGGMLLGRESATLAVSTFLEAYCAKQEGEPVADALLRSLLRTNDAVKGMAAQAGHLGSAGTTLIAAVIQEEKMYWTSVGDSRIYIVGENGIRQVTADHTLETRLRRLAEKGHLDPAEIEANPQREALTSFIGIEELREIDGCGPPAELRAGDRVLLCSDGLYKTLTGGEILEIALGSPSRGIAENLVRRALAKKKPGQDNITVAVLSCAAPARRRESETIVTEALGRKHDP